MCEMCTTITTFAHTINKHIRLIVEDHVTLKIGVMAAENSLSIDDKFFVKGIKLHLKIILLFCNCNNISHYYWFYCV